MIRWCSAVTKEVTFDFNVEKDTAEDVAREMVKDLNLDCNVGWLTSQLQERGDAMQMLWLCDLLYVQ